MPRLLPTLPAMPPLLVWRHACRHDGRGIYGGFAMPARCHALFGSNNGRGATSETVRCRNVKV